ncbi:MAG: monovalent cation/H(+) antiporter subunit G [Actinomycetota bacterium]|nr:monovalent cation/H(+) antiporter subunit G [Actinomycetota bacterium]
MSMDVALDVVAAVFLLGGAFLSLVAGVGIVRFPDLLARMHAGTKPQVLGMLFMLIGLGVRLRSWGVAGLLLLVILFQMLTAPVGAHMVARAGYRTGKVRTEDLAFDELTDDTERSDGPSPGPASNRT